MGSAFSFKSARAVMAQGEAAPRVEMESTAKKHKAAGDSAGADGVARMPRLRQVHPVLPPPVCQPINALTPAREADQIRAHYPAG